MTPRLSRQAIALALFTALLHFALPFLHMVAASNQGQGLVLCSGNGVQIIFNPPALSGSGKSNPAPGMAQMQPCPLCAHTVQAAPLQPLLVGIAVVRYVHATAVLLTPRPAPRAFVRMFRRGRAPPVFSA